jgi:choline dehydrogenase-like flavoprotein
MPSPVRLLNVILPFAAAAAATSYDYVIIGGGATGLSLGVRLSEDPTKTVVVLEAGARYVYISVVFLRAF